MGQKVNPISLRIGINKGWQSRWYANSKTYLRNLHEDLLIRRYIEKNIKDAGITIIEVERASDQTKVNIHTAKPGIVIGRQGANVEQLRSHLEKRFNQKFEININEVRKPELEAAVIAEDVASQISRRVNYRRACKTAISRAMEAGAKGVKIRVAGRLNGAEIAREEFYKEGNIPLHTFRSDISYSYRQAWTTFGAIGVKVWIYRGEIFRKGIPTPTENQKKPNQSK